LSGFYSSKVRTGVEIAVFVTRKGGYEVLVLHRSVEQGGYWHVVAGGVERGETAPEAAERELEEETGLLATPTPEIEVVEYVYPLTEEPADSRDRYDPSIAEVEVTCFHVTARMTGSRDSTGSTTVTVGARLPRRSRSCVGQRPHRPFARS
jgi:8-oxo-dGTP pyrophosphatase MutT (NUDIX family)